MALKALASVPSMYTDWTAYSAMLFSCVVMAVQTHTTMQTNTRHPACKPWKQFAVNSHAFVQHLSSAAVLLHVKT